MPRALAFLAVSCLLATPAAAQELSEADRRVAQEHFERGTLAFERGDYGEAAAEFRAAYALTRHADLLYNIYSAQERNGELAEAAEALEGYLADGDVEGDRREALELRLERLRLRVEQERLQEAERAAEAQREREAAAAQLEREQADREAAEAQAETHRGQRVAQLRAAHGTADAVTITGVVTFSTGAAGLIAFAVLAGLSTAEDASLAGSCGRDAGRICRPQDVETLEALNLGADVALIAGGALAAVGAVVVAVGHALRPDEDPDALEAWIAPSIGPGFAGLSGGARW